MGTLSGTNFCQHTPPKMLPPRQQHPRPSGLQTTLSIASSDAAGFPGNQEHGASSDKGRESPSGSASSRETWPTEINHSNAIIVRKVDKEKHNLNELSEQQVLHRVPTADKLTLRDVARERVEVIAERMVVLPDELLEELKTELRLMLEGTGGSQHRDKFLNLQKLVKRRSDLTSTTLMKAHRVQMEILAAINTGIQVFLSPNITLPENLLIEVFLYKRCRNIACQSAIPADGCSCGICCNRNGFCNVCMCVVCNKFDFELNTCRWIGCDLCSHWTHTDCAIRVGQIGMGSALKSEVGSSEMLFRCQACNRTSELLGWVKDVFEHCASGWDRESLKRELDIVSRIFQGSEVPRGRKLYWKCDNLIEKMKTGLSESTVCRMMLLFFQELELDSTKNSEAEEAGGLVDPQEACNRITEVVQEAVGKMEMVAEEKIHMFKRARLALEACDHELEDKAREAAELKMERQRKKQQVEELESIVRLKQAEAEIFEFKASEARQEAERLQSIVLAKSEKAEQEYATMYLKARLEEAEMEKKYLFEKIKLQESQRAPQGHSSGGGSDPLTDG